MKTRKTEFSMFLDTPGDLALQQINFCIQCHHHIRLVVYQANHHHSKAHTSQEVLTQRCSSVWRRPNRTMDSWRQQKSDARSGKCVEHATMRVAALRKRLASTLACTSTLLRLLMNICGRVDLEIALENCRTFNSGLWRVAPLRPWSRSTSEFGLKALFLPSTVLQKID